ncbi:NAD-dependent epimerase/dehydratase family protein [Kordiimonas gwangyangensis]|uniref:NAD-dependent epimerase/dehydratase family protein n=1 Tax=Kordiimonas gwangyangensis TaxID=288022 RepID=UPI0003748A6A|nr:NAD-dependent epimerase/dehydratase family protein [Kordiimonas gwangyangensis]
MKIFLTGASGYIGRHVRSTFLRAGYQVVALTRQACPPDANTKNLEWLQADLRDLSRHLEVMKRCDVIVHTAMEYSEDGEVAGADLRACEAFSHTTLPIIYTGNLFSSLSGTDGTIAEAALFNGPERLSDVDAGSRHWRNQVERVLLRLPNRVAIIRLGFVYGGIGSHLCDILPRSNSGAYVYYEGSQHEWPMVHIADVCALYLEALTADANGIFHAAQPGTLISDVVQAAARHAGRSAEARNAGDPDLRDDASAFLERSVTAHNSRARAIGWQPRIQFPDFLDSSPDVDFSERRRHA